MSSKLKVLLVSLSLTLPIAGVTELAVAQSAKPGVAAPAVVAPATPNTSDKSVADDDEARSSWGRKARVTRNA
jgi:hypothetical protein